MVITIYVTIMTTNNKFCTILKKIILKSHFGPNDLDCTQP